MAYLLEATRPSVWRQLRFLRATGLLAYDEKEETWALTQTGIPEEKTKNFQGPSKVVNP
jgi:hypothetical protein